MIMKRFIFVLIAILLCFSLTACGEDKEIVTEVKFTVYENDGTDFISFYMTSDVKPLGVWEYTISDSKLFETFLENEETNDYGTFGWGGTASYKTLVLKPVAEGNATITFNLTEGDQKQEFSVNVAKDDSGIFRIKCEEVKE